jgi:L-amino acid N-acyltransferase YncA
MGTVRELSQGSSPRTATPADLGAIQAIYAHHVLNGLASFEEAPPSREEMSARYDEIMRRGLPYVVLELEGEIAGYGYCALYRARSAYRYALEDSVYVRPDMIGRGIGRAILGALIERCAGLGYRQLVAVIGDSANIASIALHAGHGFLRVGTLRSIGFKFGRWVDSVIMQRPLGQGDAARPLSR